MAMAERETIMETKMVETAVETEVVHLVLSKKEATALKFVIGSIGGESEFRDVTSGIYYALSDAGIDSMAMYRANSPRLHIDGERIKFPAGLDSD